MEKNYIKIMNSEVDIERWKKVKPKNFETFDFGSIIVNDNNLI